ncbi:MAG: hypothetical protein J5645_07800 [Lachnospiraceae bacterium]|nr:hypothetical protein [Lachnospiraceae bacterium]
MKKLSKKNQKIIIAAVVAVVVAAAVIALIVRLTHGTNATAKTAANAAFDAIYSGDYEHFVTATVYNSDCQDALGLDQTGFLLNEIKPEFETMAAEMKEADMRYRRKASRATEYEPGSDGFARGCTMMLTAYPETATDRIERFASVDIAFRWSYKDEDGKSVSGEDSDTMWCVRIDGKWYAVPTLTLSDEE